MLVPMEQILNMYKAQGVASGRRLHSYRMVIVPFLPAMFAQKTSNPGTSQDQSGEASGQQLQHLGMARPRMQAPLRQCGGHGRSAVAGGRAAKDERSAYLVAKRRGRGRGQWLAARRACRAGRGGTDRHGSRALELHHRRRQEGVLAE